MKKLIKYLLVLVLSICVNISCDNFLTPSVDQNKTTDQALTDADGLQKTVNGAISAMSAVNYYERDFPVTIEVSSDNAYSLGLTNRFIIQDQLSYNSNNGYAAGLWSRSYGAISDVNLALQSKVKTNSEIKNIRGQAYALRALLHLNLLMSFGQQYVKGSSDKGVPYVTSFNKGNIYPSRNTVIEDWNKIGADFSKAISLIKEPNGSIDPTHMNYWAARGLQSRYFLYHEKWDSVKVAAEDIIQHGPFHITSTDDYNSTWLSGSGPQSLFEIDFRPTNHFLYDNIASIYRNPPGNAVYGDVAVTKNLYNSYTKDDVRLDLYATPSETQKGVYRMTGKYHDIQGNDNVRVIRYAEVILNYAEALARTGEQEKALKELTKITSNRNEKPYDAGTIANVLKERRKELAMEGFRLFDLARNGKSIRTLPVGGPPQVIPAGNYRFALPIPNGEINANSNITQNKGYK